MECITAILECLTGRTNGSDDTQYLITDLKIPISNSSPTKAEEQEQADAILHLIKTSEKSTRDLKIQIQEIVHTTGWYEGLAKCLLHGLEAIINAGAVTGGALKESYDKAYTVADEFVKKHPDFTKAMVTIVAIGILVLLVPWAIEALGWVLLEAMGFEELGVAEGSFAAFWQSTFHDAEAGSFFSYLQRMGMTWGKK